jgi:excisionase family DNA binding protein
MKLVNIKRLAEQLGVTERHVRQMIVEGRWPVYRVGKSRVRLDYDEITRLCRERGVEAARKCQNESHTTEAGGPSAAGWIMARKEN